MTYDEALAEVDRLTALLDCAREVARAQDKELGAMQRQHDADTETILTLTATVDHLRAQLATHQPTPA